MTQQQPQTIVIVNKHDSGCLGRGCGCLLVIVGVGLLIFLMMAAL